jgi:hypothetical protein
VIVLAWIALGIAVTAMVIALLSVGAGGKGQHRR